MNATIGGAASRGTGPLRRLEVAVLSALLLALTAPSPFAASAPFPLAVDMSGNGTVEDAAAFGVYLADVEITVWGSSGIVAGPLQVTSGPNGEYRWSIAQVPPGSLANLTLKASLPWDTNITVLLTYDISNASPRTDYSGVILTLPFAAAEQLTLSAPLAPVAAPRGRSTLLTFQIDNTGNVTIGHRGFNVSLSSPNLTATWDLSTGLTDRLPDDAFSLLVDLAVAPSAGLENATASALITGLNGRVFSFGVTAQVAPNRNAALEGILTDPNPLAEARPATISVRAANRGLDLAPSSEVRVRAFNSTDPNLYSNATRVDLAPGASTLVNFSWVPAWSPEPVTLAATVVAAFDYESVDNSVSAVFPVRPTNEPPAVNFTTPADGARVAGSVLVAGVAIDPESGNVSVALSIDGGPFFAVTGQGSFTYDWDLSALPDGPHTLSARATDDRGLSMTRVLSVIVLNRGPNAPPTLSVDSPQEGDVVGARVLVQGRAADERAELEGVFVSIDGGPEIIANGTTTWSFVWDVSAASQGPHTLRVRAYDGIDPSAPVVFNITLNLSAPTGLTVDGLALDPPTAVPAQAIRLTGRVRFDTGVLAEGARVSASVREFPAAAFEGLTDVRGRFAVSVTAPDSKGDFSLDVFARLDNLTGAGSVPLLVSTSTLPDLEILPSGFTLSPDPPRAGEPTRHSVEVRNLAGSPANATVRVFEGSRSTLIFEQRIFAAQFWSGTFDHTYTLGQHNLTIAVEDVDPPDADLSNNAISVSVDVIASPDLVLVSITPSILDPVEGVNITFLLIVGNAGDILAVAAVEVWDGLPLAANSTLIHQEFVSFLPGRTERVYAIWTPAAGTHTIFAKIVLSDPPESTLTNNEANLTISVRPAPEARPTPFLPGLGGAGAAAVLTVLAAAVGARRRSNRLAGDSRGRRRRSASIIGILVAPCAIALLPFSGTGDLQDAGRMPGALNGVCQACHINPNTGGPLNAFGQDYWAERNATSGDVNWTRLGALDSDGDGFNNSVEWEGSYLPGDPASNPQTGVRYAASANPFSILVSALALFVLVVVGVGLGFWALNRRNARLARQEAADRAKEADGPIAPDESSLQKP